MKSKKKKKLAGKTAPAGTGWHQLGSYLCRTIEGRVEGGFILTAAGQKIPAKPIRLYAGDGWRLCEGIPWEDFCRLYHRGRAALATE